MKLRYDKTGLGILDQVFAALSSEQKLLQATLVWLVVCYSPGDLAHSLVKNKVLHDMCCWHSSSILIVNILIVDVDCIAFKMMA